LIDAFDVSNDPHLVTQTLNLEKDCKSTNFKLLNSGEAIVGNTPNTKLLDRALRPERESKWIDGQHEIWNGARRMIPALEIPRYRVTIVQVKRDE
jgi:hypothetical protein